MPDRSSQPGRGFGNAESHRRYPVVLVPARRQSEVERLDLARERAAGVHLIDQFVNVHLVRPKRRAVGRVATGQAFQCAHRVIVGVDLVNQITRRIEP